MRNTHSSSLLSLVVGAALAVAGCGDGIDERTEPLAPEHAATTTTTEPEPVELPSFEIDESDLVIDNTGADYSGARSALHLADGTWLVTGYDNHSTPEQPEPGAVWRGDEFTELERTGEDISDEDGQQVIASLVELASGRIVASGTNFSRDDLTAEFATHDADVWLSDDQGSTFRKVSLRLDAAVAGAVVADDVIYVHGFQYGDGDEGVATGQIWRSDDDGETWDELDPTTTPTPGSAPEPLGTVDELLYWEGSLVAVGRTTSTDPDGGVDYPLDRYALSSATEEWEPVDVGLWYSDDLGATWRAALPAGLSGQRNAQVATDAVAVGDQLVIVGSSSEGSQIPFEFDPEFDLENFDPENFDLDDFDPDDFDFDEGLMLPTMWTCDYLLQRCDSITLDTEGSEFVTGLVVERNGLALVAFSGYSGDAEDGELLVALEPLSGEFAALTLTRSFAQTSAIVVDGDQVVLFGRHSRLDELDALVATITE